MAILTPADCLIDGRGLWCDPAPASRPAPVAPPPSARAALFLDRDGVVIEDTGFVGRPEDARPVAGAADLIRACNRAGVPVVLVTNQSGIGRGYYDWHGFAAVQAWIVGHLAAAGAHLDMTLACAYHADAPPPFDIADHPWRKPRPGMLLAAADALNLALGDSWIIGDRPGDLAAGVAAGLSGGLLLGGASPATPADFTVVRGETLADAAPVLAALGCATEGDRLRQSSAALRHRRS